MQRELYKFGKWMQQEGYAPSTLVSRVKLLKILHQ